MTGGSQRGPKTYASKPEEGAVWKAGIYARLSADSDERKNESIGTQIQIAKEYISRESGIVLAGCYTDLGKTGTNFNREGFEHLMADVRRKKINCVIVKDFSRFGRDYIETGNYIEKIFPFMQVRFIAVTDDYDSEYSAENDAGLTVNLKNIVNELYARDIAQRVKISKKLKQEMGSYTGGVPPYGYRTEKLGDRNVLFPETVTKDIVAWIYESYAGGSTYREIARELYNRRIQRPTAYRATGQVYCPDDGILQQWPYDTIKWILTNPAYIGTLFQARTCGREYRSHKRHEVDVKNDVTVVEHTHEPIVSEELFYQAAQRFERQSRFANSRGFSKRIPQCEDIFKEKLFCGECGCHLTRNSAVRTLSSGDRVRSYYYSCPNKRRVDSSACRCRGISLKELEAVLKSVLKKESALREGSMEDYCREAEKCTEEQKESVREKREKILQKQRELALEESRQYLKYRRGQLSREAFVNEKKKGEVRLEELKKLDGELERREQQASERSDQLCRYIRVLAECGEDMVLDSEFVNCLVKQIYAGPGRQVEIIFNYNRGRAGE